MCLEVCMWTGCVTEWTCKLHRELNLCQQSTVNARQQKPVRITTLQCKGRRRRGHEYEEILLWESQLPYITLSAVVCIFVTAHLCIFVHTSSNKVFFWEKILILGAPLSTHTILHFAALIYRTVENSRLILTHRYLVLVVFAGQHLHTSRFELSHLFHCGGMQEESFISQVKVQ